MPLLRAVSVKRAPNLATACAPCSGFASTGLHADDGVVERRRSSVSGKTTDTSGATAVDGRGRGARRSDPDDDETQRESRGAKRLAARSASVREMSSVQPHNSPSSATSAIGPSTNVLLRLAEYKLAGAGLNSPSLDRRYSVVGARCISVPTSSWSGSPLEHRADAFRDRQLDPEPVREIAQHRRRRQALDDHPDLAVRRRRDRCPARSARRPGGCGRTSTST